MRKKSIFLGTLLILVSLMFFEGCSQAQSTAPTEEKSITLSGSAEFFLPVKNGDVAVFDADNKLVEKFDKVTDENGFFHITLSNLNEPFKIVVSNGTVNGEKFTRKIVLYVSGKEELRNLEIDPISTGIYYEYMAGNTSFTEATKSFQLKYSDQLSAFDRLDKENSTRSSYYAKYIISKLHLLDKIEVYDRITLEDVYGDADLAAHFGIYDKKTPADYGYDYSSYTYKSVDGLDLAGWYIKSKNLNSKKTIILIHGRTSNKLKPMKYLELIGDKSLTDEYNVFIPDFRNSGEATISKTYMGYKFADDVYSTVKFLKDNFEDEHFVLYGFSMGGMAISYSMNKYSGFKSLGVTIDKIVLDSPLSDVRGNLINESTHTILFGNVTIPTWVAEILLYIYDIDIDGHLSEMTLQNNFKDVYIPILILASKKDTYVPVELLTPQMPNFNSNITVKLFDNGEHVLMYTTPGQKIEYTNIVGEFIK